VIADSLIIPPAGEICGKPFDLATLPGMGRGWRRRGCSGHLFAIAVPRLVGPELRPGATLTVEAQASRTPDFQAARAVATIVQCGGQLALAAGDGHQAVRFRVARGFAAYLRLVVKRSDAGGATSKAAALVVDVDGNEDALCSPGK
jgi:hypothetical protein